MKVALLGATQGMGRALARQFATRGDAICLLGRDEVELQRSAEDLKARGGHTVHLLTCDLGDADRFDTLLAEAQERLGGLDTVVLSAAAFASQEELESDRDRLATLLDLNFTKSILFCEAARERLLDLGGGTLCVFSSVAGERGRKPVVLYGATKAGLSAYLEGLDHKFRADGLRTVCVKPGFVKTGMTAGLKPPPFAGEADEVAKRLLRAIDRGSPVVYAPATWRWIMWVIRSLPRVIMRKISF
jgi:short-subunit dehydrogenase